MKLLIIFLILIFFFLACLFIGAAEFRRNTMIITSPAFQHEGMIPPKYTCKGEDKSPQLKWENAPTNVKSFVLICDDPDAPIGTWDHWILFNIPPTQNQLEEGIPKKAELPDGSKHGKNSWGRTDYGGPCPPFGTHRYFFKLYALDTLLNLKSGASKKDVLKAMDNHILEQAELIGKFKK